MRALCGALAARPDAPACRCRPPQYPARDFSLVDVNAAGATKGGALAAVAAPLRRRPRRGLAVGDNHNDLDMLRWAGTGVVMGNAEPELLRLGLPVDRRRNDEAGLAQALRRLRAVAAPADAAPGPLPLKT